jgi:hypothetical protein
MRNREQWGEGLGECMKKAVGKWNRRETERSSLERA